MAFGRKVQRVVDLKKAEEIYRTEEHEPLEKGDKLALLISALIVYVPALLVFCGVVYALLYFFI